MKKINIQWITSERSEYISNSVSNIAYFPPEPAFKYLLETKPNSEYIRCPSVSEYLKNTYVIKCPYDMVFKKEKNNTITTDRFDQKFFDNNVNYRNNILQTFPSYLFITDSKIPVEIRAMPWFLDNKNAFFIPGSFDITKWVRNINYAVEMQDDVLELKRGDVLFCVQFIAKDSKIELTQGIMTPEILSMLHACVNIKHRVPKLNLKALYDMGESFINLMKKEIFK